MVKGFDIIGSNKALQEHWVKRIVAAIIDSIIVFIPLYIIFNILLWVTFLGWGWYWLGWTWWLFEGFIFFLYFVFLETVMGASIGKKIMNLQVVTTTGAPLNISSVFMRNLSKIFFLHWLDALLGLVTDGDPRQKFIDRTANVTVTRTDAQAYIEEQFRQMQYVPPHPHVPPGAWGTPPPAGQPGQQPPQYQQAPPSQPQQPPPGGWPQQSGGWGSQPQSQQSQWPQHKWDEEGRLMSQPKFCSSCGGSLNPRGDGKMACVRCGLTY